MPVTYSQMVANTANIALQVGDNTLNITYYPELITDDVFLLVNSFLTVQGSTMLDTLTVLNKTLASLIKSWDAVEDDGQTMMPITEDTFRKFSVNFKSSILTEMIGNVRPEAGTPQTTLS